MGKAIGVPAYLRYHKGQFASTSFGRFPTHSRIHAPPYSDLHHKQSVDMDAVKSSGVAAVIHKATEGLDFNDKKYHQRKSRARELGILWGSYHFSNNSDAQRQAVHFLEFAKPEDGEVMCLDFEHNKGKGKSCPGARFCKNNKGEDRSLSNATMTETIGLSIAAAFAVQAPIDAFTAIAPIAARRFIECIFAPSKKC